MRWGRGWREVLIFKFLWTPTVQGTSCLEANLRALQKIAGRSDPSRILSEQEPQVISESPGQTHPESLTCTSFPHL